MRALGGKLLAEDALLLQLGKLLQLRCGCRPPAERDACRGCGLLRQPPRPLPAPSLPAAVAAPKQPRRSAGRLSLLVPVTTDNCRSRAGDHCGPGHRSDQAGAADLGQLHVASASDPPHSLRAAANALLDGLRIEPVVSDQMAAGLEDGITRSLPRCSPTR